MVAIGASGATGTAAEAAQVTENVASTATGLFDTRCVSRMASDANHSAEVVPTGRRTGSANSTRTAEGGSVGCATASGTTTRATRGDVVSMPTHTLIGRSVTWSLPSSPTSMMAGPTLMPF